MATTQNNHPPTWWPPPRQLQGILDAKHVNDDAWNPALTSIVPQPPRRQHGSLKARLVGDALSAGQGWRRYVRNFTPSWFTVNMATGIVGVLLKQFPYNADWLYWLSIIVFCSNVLLFTLFTSVSAVRYFVWPEIFWAVIIHPNQALFVGAVPIGWGTIVNMAVLVCVPVWGEWAAWTAWGMWTAEAALSLVAAIYVPFLLIVKQEQEVKLSSFTALQMLPVAATIVSAAGAGVVAEVLPNPQCALVTTIIGYVLLGVGFPTALMILVIYFHRLTIHKLPPREIIVSGFLPLGMLNMGAFALLQLGSVALKTFPQTHTLNPLAGATAYNMGVFISFMLWGFSWLWWFLAWAAIYHFRRLPYNMGWWGFVFPIGAMALATDKLATEVPSRFFRVVGSIISVITFLLWILVSTYTLRDIYAGGYKAFNAPGLNDIQDKKVDDNEKVSPRPPDAGRDGMKLDHASQTTGGVV